MEPVNPKNLDETVRLQSEKREEWIREIREERLQEIAEDASSGQLISHVVFRKKQVSRDPL